MQLALSFEPIRARRADPSTSQHAADLVREFEGEHFSKILKAVNDAPGTIYEIAAATGLTHVQVARRMNELEQATRVRVQRDEQGSEVKRPSPSGRPCRVWEIPR